MGDFGGYVGPLLNHFRTMLSLCWVILGLCWTHVGPFGVYVGPFDASSNSSSSEEGRKHFSCSQERRIHHVFQISLTYLISEHSVVSVGKSV